MRDNRHTRAIPENVLTEALAKTEELKALLKPYLLALTPKERQEIRKMGEKTLAFVEKSHEYAHTNPNLVPPFLQLDAFDADFADAHGIWTLHSKVSQITDGLYDTQMVAGSEAYQSALLLYKSVKSAAEQDIPGAKTVYEELKYCSPKPGRRKKRL